jgi:hypothetical protein
MYTTTEIELMLRVLKRPVKLVETLKAESAGIVWTDGEVDICYNGERLAAHKAGRFCEGDEAYALIGGKDALVGPKPKKVICEGVSQSDGSMDYIPLSFNLGDVYDYAQERNIRLFAVEYGYDAMLNEFYSVRKERVNQAMESYQDYLSLMDSKFGLMIKIYS